MESDRRRARPATAGRSAPPAPGPITPEPQRPQQFLNFFPLPQGQGSFRPTFWPKLRIGSTADASAGRAGSGSSAAGSAVVAGLGAAWIAAVSLQVLRSARLGGERCLSRRSERDGERAGGGAR